MGGVNIPAVAVRQEFRFRIALAREISVVASLFPVVVVVVRYVCERIANCAHRQCICSSFPPPLLDTPLPGNNKNCNLAAAQIKKCRRKWSDALKDSLEAGDACIRFIHLSRRVSSAGVSCSKCVLIAFTMSGAIYRGVAARTSRGGKGERES